MGAKDSSYEYDPLIERLKSVRLSDDRVQALDSPDRRDGLIYDYDDELHLAVQIALATGRPLLLRGAPGSGKSSLAAFVARNLNWRYYEHTVTGDTRAQDLLWRYDVVRRLADAQALTGRGDSEGLNDLDYIEPGVLWWVFNAKSAKQRGYLEISRAQRSDSRRPAIEASDPNQEVNRERHPDRAVVLIDELDKADPEVPNALLVPLGSNKFRVSDVDVEVTWEPRRSGDGEADPESGGGETSRLLVLITTNEERQLPPAFLRRCVVRYLSHPDADRLVQIAKLHFGRAGKPMTKKETVMSRKIAERVVRLRDEAEAEALRPPSTAEYLDAVRASLVMKIAVSDDPNSAWVTLERATLLKIDRQEEDDTDEDGGAGENE